jgi:hypothetical protein
VVGNEDPVPMVVQVAPLSMLTCAMAKLNAVPVYDMVTRLDPEAQIVLGVMVWLTAVIPLLSTVIATGFEYTVQATLVTLTR